MKLVSNPTKRLVPVQPAANAKSCLISQCNLYCYRQIEPSQCNLLLTPNRAFPVQLTANAEAGLPVQPTANAKRAFPVQPTANPKKAIECRSCSYGKLLAAAGALDSIFIIISCGQTYFPNKAL